MKISQPILARPIGLQVTVPLLVLILACSTVWAPAGMAQPAFVNGQAARLVIGQPSFTRQAPVSSRETIGGAGGIAIANNRLFIADGNEMGSTPLNNRVLLYNNLSSFIPDLKSTFPQPGKGAPANAFCPACVGLADVVLGQPDFNTFNPRRSDGFQNPAAVASDGTMLAVADTDNNRVLIWRSLPAVNGTPPDVVVGQPDLTSGAPRTAADGMRGPQGVWIDGNRLFVADTQNGRVLIFSPVPSASGASANIVLGQPDFTTRPEPDLTQSNVEVTASSMLDPVSVTVSNNRLFVTDLGFNRVMVYLTVPTANNFPADVVVGQKDFESALPNDSTALCEPLPPPPPSNIDIGNPPAPGCTVSEQTEMTCTDGLDNDCDGLIDRNDSENCCVKTQDTETFCSDGVDNDCDGDIDFFNDDDCGPAFPARCEATLSFPRYALSDGQKLFIADGGNDRVLVFNEIPLENGASADVVLGQPDFQANEESTGAASLRAPSSLASDGTNLYVADPFTRRVLVFTPAEDQIVQDGLVNGAAFQVPASGFVFLQGTLQANQKTTVVIGPRQYQHTAVEGDDAEDAVTFILNGINADPHAVVTATPAISSGEHASGSFTFAGEIQAGDRLTLNIGVETYEVEVQAGDEPFVMVDRFVNAIRANPDSAYYALRDVRGDVLNRLRFVFRTIGPQANGIPYSMTASPGARITFTAEDTALKGGFQAYGFRVFAKEPGTAGNSISVRTQTSLSGVTAPSASGQLLTGGSDARELPVGTIASIFGSGFADQGWAAQTAFPNLPTELGGVQVYVNGVLAPLYSVTPEQINFQVPFETMGTTVSVYVRRVHDDGTVTVSVPRASRVARASPGLFAFPGPEPRQAIAVHGTGVAQGSIAVTQVQVSTGDTNQGVDAGVVLTVKVQGRPYTYTTVQGDTPATIRDGLVAAINAGEGDPTVTASASREGFFSARADVTLTGEIKAGDVVTITINGRAYAVVVREGHTLTIVRNLLVQEINAGQGDPEATARRIDGFDPNAPVLQVVARSLGDDGNSITFTVTVNQGASIQAETNAEDGLLQGGQTPPVVVLTGRILGREANEIEFSAESSNTAIVSVATRASTLCCGNEPFSLITPENPAVPGESIVLFATGLGQTAPTPQSLGVSSGEPIPTGTLFNVPFNALDFVSSLVDGRSAVIQFVGLMPGQVGVYQINMRINEGLEDNPAAPLTIAQVLFISNVVTIPVKNLRPRSDAF